MAASFVDIPEPGQCDVCGTTLFKEDEHVHEIVRDSANPAKIVGKTVWCMKCYAQTAAEYYHRIHDGQITKWNVNNLKLAEEITEIFKPKIQSIKVTRP